MRRIHLFELEDLDWVPRAVRDGGTDLLDLLFDRLGFYRGVAPRLAATLDATGTSAIIDLCSGGGGGTLQTWRALGERRARVTLTLTDRHPSASAVARVASLGEERVRYEAGSVDAMEGGGARDGLRTMSGALHHFPPDAVRALVGGIVARRQPLLFFDVAASPALRRAPILLLPLAMALNLAMLVVACLVLVPFVRPFSASRLLLTYVLPAIPCLFAWDGTVSALRAYTPDEVLELARAAPGGDRYRWEAGVEGPALYLSGVPI